MLSTNAGWLMVSTWCTRVWGVTAILAGGAVQGPFLDTMVWVLHAAWVLQWATGWTVGKWQYCTGEWNQDLRAALGKKKG
jgi:hypothetical protein